MFRRKIKFLSLLCWVAYLDVMARKVQFRNSKNSVHLFSDKENTSINFIVELNQ